jgi:transketolase
MTEQQPKLGNALAIQFRRDSIRSSSGAGSGHPTSALSAADLIAVLVSSFLKYDFDKPEHPANDHLIFSKGHASPLLYAMYKTAGVISDEELLSYRTFGSRLEGHPTPRLPWVDVATGSLGQGLPVGVGIALAGKYLDKVPYRVWVLCGDSEMAEGSVWEAFGKAGYYGLNNVTAILDMNRLGQRGPTELGWNAEAYSDRARAFGWHSISIDGHDLNAIESAYEEAAAHDRPTLIVAKTIKGRGVSFLEDQEGLHGKPVSEDQVQQALNELGPDEPVSVSVSKPDQVELSVPTATKALSLPTYELGTEVATRQVYGEALKALREARADVVALDGEVSNSTHADIFAKAFPERFFEMFIAEQQMVAAAVGLSVRGYVPFASSFGAFLTRAYDFIRMAAVSRATIKLCGSHAGVSIGEDGPSQMALEDFAMMRAVHGSTVLHPCDGNQTAKLVAAMADLEGISYLRTLRGKTPLVYSPEETFPVGGSKTLKQSEADKVTIVAAGITVHEALSAYDEFQEEGIALRIIDAYSVKPIDRQTLWEAVQATDGRLVVVEDHWPEGGLGDAVVVALTQNAVPLASSLKLTHLAVREMPISGTPAETLSAAGIDARAITSAVRELLS